MDRDGRSAPAPLEEQEDFFTSEDLLADLEMLDELEKQSAAAAGSSSRSPATAAVWKALEALSANAIPDLGFDSLDMEPGVSPSDIDWQALRLIVALSRTPDVSANLAAAVVRDRDAGAEDLPSVSAVTEALMFALPERIEALRTRLQEETVEKQLPALKERLDRARQSVKEADALEATLSS